MRVNIIGGGIIGASIAYHLCSTAEVHVYEKDSTYGLSSFARSCGGLRSQYSTATNIQMSRFSIGFVKRLGPMVNWTGNGYLMLFGPDQASDCRRSLRLQKAQGATTRCLRPDQLIKLHPYLNTDDVWRGCQTFDQSEGWIDPVSLHGFYVTAAKAAGATWHQADGRQAEPADMTVIASGCWTGEVAKHWGLDIPVRGHKHTVFVVSTEKPVLHKLPLVADLITGVYLRPEGTGYIVGYDGNGDWDSDNLEPDLGSWDTVWELLYQRFPDVFDAARMESAWSGWYDSSTIDNNAIIDKFDNVVVATGFTGRGLMHSPAVGLVVSDLVMGRDLSFDISAYKLDREPDIEKYVI